AVSAAVPPAPRVGRGISARVLQRLSELPGSRGPEPRLTRRSVECADLPRHPPAAPRQPTRRHALSQLHSQREHDDRAAGAGAGREGRAGLLRVQAATDAMTSLSRVVVYMAGLGVPQHVGIVEALLPLRPSTSPPAF